MWYLNTACSERFIREHAANATVLNACCDLRQTNHSYLMLPDESPPWVNGTGK